MQLLENTKVNQANISNFQCHSERFPCYNFARFRRFVMAPKWTPDLALYRDFGRQRSRQSVNRKQERMAVRKGASTQLSRLSMPPTQSLEI